MNFKNCAYYDLRKHICKLEARLSSIKSYVNCEVSILTNKIESFSNDFEKRINTLQGKEKSKIEILQQNMTFLQNELLSKNEMIKSLMEIQSSVLYTMTKISPTSEHYSPTQSQSLHHLQPQSESSTSEFNVRVQPQSSTSAHSSDVFCLLEIRGNFFFCIFSGNCLKSSRNFISTGTSTIEDHSNIAYLL